MLTGRQLKRPSQDNTRRRIEKVVRDARHGSPAVVMINDDDGDFAFAIVPHDDRYCCMAAMKGRWAMRYRRGLPSYGEARDAFHILKMALDGHFPLQRT